MLTGIRSDSGRIQKQLEMSTFEGRYQLNVPGPGVNVGFIEDPHIRLQHWGCNLYYDRVVVENELSNRNRNSPDLGPPFRPMSRHMNPAENVPTIESRHSLPAWIFRDKETERQPISLAANHENYSPHSTSSRLLPKPMSKVADMYMPVFKLPIANSKS